MPTPPLPPLPRWATYIPSRSPKHKMHEKRGLASSAVANKFPDGEGHIFELVDGEWKLVYSYYPAQECAWCKGDFWAANPYSNRTHIYRYTPIKHKGPNYLADVICSSCSRKEKAAYQQEMQERQERAQYEKLQEKYGNRE